jgi:heterodisulfide reductase subunit A
MKLRPVDFATEGIFLCGMAHWPKFIDESISQASGTAARALTILSKDILEAEGIVANVNDKLCAGCGVCEAICEYKAIEVSENQSIPDRQTAMVNEGVCKGCGACVGACPSGAVNQRGFKNHHLYRMIEAFLEAV